VSDVSREFPRVSVLKFSVSGRQDDTLCYKIGCRLPRRLGTPACMRNLAAASSPPRLRGVQNGISEITR
jgi:hypothetical protein